MNVTATCVVGAGAVGSLLAGMLCRRGQRVSLLGREEHLEAIGNDGLILEDRTGSWASETVSGFENLWTHLPETSQSAFDLVLVTTRAVDTGNAAELANSLLAPGGICLSVQNGIGNWEALAGTAGWNRVVGGILTSGVEIHKPGHVRVTVHGQPLLVGRPARSNATPFCRVRELADWLAGLGIDARFEQNIEGMLWRKLVYNCILNAPAALRNGPYARVLEDAEGRADTEAIIEECYEVAHAAGIRIDPPDSDGFRDWFYGSESGPGAFARTAAHSPSMLHHLRQGKRTEVESMNGAIVRLALEHGVSAPTNEKYLERILEREHLLAGKG